MGKCFSKLFNEILIASGTSFHPFNIGNMAKKNSQPLFLPCTPKGIIQLIESTGVEIAGKHAVVIGRSDIVGSPVATLLTAKHATVTLCHSKTVNIESFVNIHSRQPIVHIN